MYIRTLELRNYRNYEVLSIELSQGVNILYGDNAQGKTNLLESIYVASTAKSHRSYKDKDLIQFDKEEAHIKMQVIVGGHLHRIDMHIKKNKNKGVAIDGIPLKRASELYGFIHVVMFSPEDLSIIKNSPSERRRFMDVELCQLDPVYVHDLSQYNRIIQQRNNVLKEMNWKEKNDILLDVMDEQLCRYAKTIIERREKFTAQLDHITQEIHSHITGGNEQISIQYEKNCEPTFMAEILKKNRDREIRQKTTLFGPHRDDLCFSVNGIDLRKYGSQGQQRTAALTLKLAEIDLVRWITRDTPILLLDDVLSELDGKRQTYLLNSLSGIQTVITCTGLDDFIKNRFQMDKIFHIENGTWM